MGHWPENHLVDKVMLVCLVMGGLVKSLLACGGRN